MPESQVEELQVESSQPSPNSQQPIANGPAIASPRLRELAERLDAGDAGGLEAFWQEMAEQGTPLIEAVDDRPDRRLVTFVLRERDDVQPVENAIVFNSLGSEDFP